MCIRDRLIIPLLILAAVRSLRRRAEAQLVGFEKFAEVHTNLLSQIAKETEALARCSTDLLDAIETTHELDAEAQEIEAKAYQRLKNLEELTAHTHRLLEWLGKQTQLSNQTAGEEVTETE